MIDKSGIRSLFAIDNLPEEVEEQNKARAEVMARLNVKPETTLQAAGKELDLPKINFDNLKPAAAAPIKEDPYSDAAIKKDVQNKIAKNRAKGRDRYAGMSKNDVVIAEIMKDEAEEKLKNMGYNKKTVTGPAKNKKNFLRGSIVVDQNHPDGFRLTDDQDLYDVYGKDDGIRYIQEMAYKYDDVPIKDAVKPFNSYDKSTYPSDPAQQAALRSYERLYNRLTPLQKKQIVKAKNGGLISNYKKQFRKP